MSRLKGKLNKKIGLQIEWFQCDPNFNSVYNFLSLQAIIMGNETIGNHTVVQKIGKGRFGKTRLCRTVDNYLNTIKIYQVLPERNMLDILKQFKHFLKVEVKSRVPIKDIFVIDSNRFGVVMEYYDRASLVSRMWLGSLIDKLKLMKELALEVQNLHQKHKVIHKNLKPQNIFLVEDEVFFSDFTAPCFAFLRIRQTLGSFDYQAPQNYQGVNSFASDVWSLGVIFIEILMSNRIRNIEMLGQIVKPSIRGSQYPSPQIVNQIQSLDLNQLIKMMVDINPLQRIDISEVLRLLDDMLNTKKKSTSPVKNNNLAGDIFSLAINQEVSQKYFHFEFDYNHPCVSNFHFAGKRVRRADKEPRRYQAVSRESIPAGRWFVTLRINNYGDQNEQVVVGVLSEQRRKQKMSGDIDQYNSISLWTTLANQQSNICQNGVWLNNPLPLLRQREGILKIIIDTEQRQIVWVIDGKLASVSSMPQSYWNQELFVFVALKGFNCQVQFGDKDQFKR